MIHQIHDTLWRIQIDGTAVGWIQYLPVANEHRYRARRRCPRGLGASLGEYDTVDEAATAILDPQVQPKPRPPRRPRVSVNRRRAELRNQWPIEN